MSQEYNVNLSNRDRRHSITKPQFVLLESIRNGFELRRHEILGDVFYKRGDDTIPSYMVNALKRHGLIEFIDGLAVVTEQGRLYEC